MPEPVSVIVNSHMDPVWLWNLSAGRRAWSNTVTTIVSLMKEFPEMTFSCSSAQLYRWIETTNRPLFRDIQALFREGRWEIIGGWEVQSDVVIASAESIRRQGISGKEYFRDRFDTDVRIAFNVDSFGHSADLPDLLCETGFDSYVYVRGNPLPELFRWNSPTGKSVTAHQIRNGYGMLPNLDREQFFRRVRTEAERDGSAKTFFFGVGDHGGQLSREYLRMLMEAMKEYPLRFSTLSRYFAEHRDDPLPEYTGDLGPVFRGCYSANHRVKQALAETEHTLLQAELFGDDAAKAELEKPWLDTLLADFHDSLPGTCIRETYERDIYPMLGGAKTKAQTIIDTSLAIRETAHDTRFAPEGGLFAVNPSAERALLPVSFPAFTDPNGTGQEFNALMDRDGNFSPVMILPPDNSYGPFGTPWGKITAVLPVDARSEKIFALTRTATPFPDVDPAPLKELLNQLQWQIYHDDTGTWGFGLDSFDGQFDVPRTESVRFSSGTVCAEADAEYRWRDSKIRLHLTLFSGLPDIRISVECDWHEHFTALKLAWIHPAPSGTAELLRRRHLSCAAHELNLHSGREWRNGRPEYRLETTGEQPFINWCALQCGGHVSGFFSPDLHGCDALGASLRLTLLRCLPYADHKPFTPNTRCGFLDEGRTAYEFWFCSGSPERIQNMRMMEFCEITPHPPFPAEVQG